MYLIRFGELAIKSHRVRRRALKQLVENVSFLLRVHQIPHNIWQTRGRVFVDTGEHDASELLKHVFGIVSFSEVKQYEFTNLTDLSEWVASLFYDTVRGKTFGVRVRRVGVHDFSSRDAELVIAERLYPLTKGVNLRSPDVWVRCEIRDTTVYAILNTYDGPGGLPTGFEGKALALFSGGIDSPVASWYMLKRGVKLDYVYFDLGDPSIVYHAFKEFALQWCQYSPRFHVIRFSKVIQALLGFEPKYRQVLLKLIMYEIAGKLGYSAIVTGESLAQASTQTLSNLRVLDALSDTFVLRPLLGFDKEETVRVAKHIGTYETSILIPEFCNLAQGPVITHGSPKLFKPLFDELKEYLEYTVETYSISKPYPVNEGGRPTSFDEIINLETQNYQQLLHTYHEDWDHEKTYFIVCKTGLKAKILASLARENGFKAYSGTLQDLVKHS